MILPIFKDDNTNLMLMQNKWASTLNPFLTNPVLNGLLLKNLTLKNGDTVINHFLGRPMQGWILADVDGAATIYRSKPLNSVNLTLTSNAAVTVSLWVF